MATATSTASTTPTAAGDALARRWALDFAGYGESDRHPEMREPAHAHGPLGRAEGCSRQIAEAIRFIRTRTHARAVSIVAHSWGTLPASLYTTREAANVDRLVLFGPVTERPPAARSRKDPLPGNEPAYDFVTIRDQRDRFVGYVPSGEAPALDVRHFDAWAPAYLASDPASATRTPPSVQVPFGPSSDIERARGGTLAYDPAGITCPTLIVRGEWDSVTTDADAHCLYHALSACPLKRDVTISRGTHVMHLERSRFQLYREVQTFLSGRD
jgi:pimeloyl-ACP methyl ester carboxylesterase